MLRAGGPLACAASTCASFLVPAFNEQATIVDVLDRIQALGLDRQVIVVDDGSPTTPVRGWRSGSPATQTSCSSARRTPARARRSGRNPLHRRGHRGDPGRGHGVRPGGCAGADRANRARHRRRRLRLSALGRSAPTGVSLLAPGRKPVSLARHRHPLQHDVGGHGDRPRPSCSDVLRSLDLRQNDFSIEPEITAKVCKRKLRVYQLPIAYYGRTYAEGKKITWRDGFKALWVLARVRVRS